MSVAEDPVPPSLLNRILGNPAVRIVLPLVIAGLAVWLLHVLAAHISWHDVKTDIVAASWTSMAWAALFTLLSFAGLALYDVLAVRNTAPGEVPTTVAAATGAGGYAISNLMGFSYVTGTAVRYRIYNSFGVDAPRVAVIFATSWVAMWLGVASILGVMFVLHPAGLHSMLPISQGLEVTIGAVVLLGLGAILVWLATGERRLNLLGYHIDLPNLRLALGLTAANVFDIGGASLALYVLMPADLVQSYPYFFVIYIGAIVLGLLSHLPGGIGVFEATIIAGLGASGRSDVLAGLLLYRVVYTLMPFVLASIGLVAAWALTRRKQVTTTAIWAHKLARPMVPPVAAGIAFLAGLTLLISGSLPADSDRIKALSNLLPLSFIEASHLISSVVGLFLVVISRGLYKRLYRAWWVTVCLTTLGTILSLTKGLDWAGASFLAISTAVLLLFRSAFYRVGHSVLLRLNIGWLISIVGVTAVVIWIGLFAYSHVAYENSLWLKFTADGDASRYLRASLVLVFVLAGIALDSLVFSKKDKIERQPIPDVVRRLVAESKEADSNTALTGDKAFIISEDETAFVAYADTGKSLIAMGDPVGDPEAGTQVIWQLREQADRMGRRCAFYSVSPAYVPTFLDMGLAILKIGEVARVKLDGFTLDGSSKKGIRAAMSRAKRDGFVFEILRKEQLPEALEELRAISDAWLKIKQGEEKNFALGAFTDAFVMNYDFAILRNSETGQIVGFANLFQSGQSNEISLDLMRYLPGSPGFVMNALFGELMMWSADQGYHWFSLGPSPFSGIESRQLASIWNRVGGFVYEHGESVYHFEGLRSFKQKFDPVWTPNYLASQGGLAVPHILFEVNVLISGGIKGLMK